MEDTLFSLWVLINQRGIQNYIEKGFTTVTITIIIVITKTSYAQVHTSLFINSI